MGTLTAQVCSCHNFSFFVYLTFSVVDWYSQNFPRDRRAIKMLGRSMPLELSCMNAECFLSSLWNIRRRLSSNNFLHMGNMGARRRTLGRHYHPPIPTQSCSRNGNFQRRQYVLFSEHIEPLSSRLCTRSWCRSTDVLRMVWCQISIATEITNHRFRRIWTIGDRRIYEALAGLIVIVSCELLCRH